MKKSYDIIFEDTEILVVNKAAGVPVIPGRTSEMDFSLKYLFKKKYGDIFIVHRIDAETSGIVILAKDAETHRRLNTMFQNRQIEKQYLLLTRGIPRPDEGEIELSLKKLNNQNKSVVSKEGKAALSTYKVLKKYQNIALCEAEIKTGRHHQLRVHFKAINTPLLVDPIYGDPGFYLSEIKAKKYNKNKDAVERPLMNRLSLHANKLSFLHPTSGEKMSFEAALPKDLRAVINQLDKSV
ncbi:RluA family pseudouridine synthase [Portibacter lacus]|uniref:Pseudouridine synthase RsuA/RluA-like domain-containing protein n=1 Tax=Portibacter lacus TaxID=1099794 RepID=A0AA37ST76_9BACT|nr:RluA family pseudouridine synthase [Portibacter lacus]GLR18336.1 hypothetical protein GCM10007940_29520 [Portibacter lacus]